MNEITIQKYGYFDAAAEVSREKLFSAGQIFAAGLFGSIFTGQLMLALNYAKLGDAKRANRKSLLSIIFLVASAIIPQLCLVPSICFILTFYSEYKRRQEVEYIERLELGGQEYSNRDVALLCVLSNVIFVLLILIIRNVFPYAFS